MITIGGTALPSDPGEGGAPLSDATPQPPGTAAAGTANTASRGDHVHTPTTAAQAGAPALSTLTTRGDIYTRGASTVVRLALGAAKRILSSDGADVVYQTIAALLTDIGDTRGMLLRRGASAWEALAAQTADTFVGGDGTDVGVRTAAQVRASIQAATTTTPSLTSATGWTNSTSGSGATSTLNTGTGTIELAVNNNGGTGRIVRTISVPADWRVQLRVATFTDTTVNVQATLSPLRSGASSAAYTVYGDGSLRALYTNAAAGSITVRAQSSAITAVRAAMTAGTLWLRVQSLGGTLSYQYAIGAVEASLVWVLFAAYAMPGAGDGEVTPDTVNLTLNRVASSGAQTATFDSVSYRDLGP